jgi:predicted nucleotidyltransferase
MSVTDAIHLAIADIEAKHDVRVLFAAESGSRAWGFASPDSDYDVRFIYVHRPDWYVGIGEPRDVIEAMLPGDLDLSGWDLRKTLRLFLRCNLALNEWLGSPIVYAERGDLARQMRDLLPAAFRAPAGYHHYLSMAQGVFNDHLANDPVRLKKVFYVLRPLLACRWIAAAGTQPPTEFDQLVAAEWVNADEREMIARLLVAKADASEAHHAPLDSVTRSWFEREMVSAQAAASKIRSTSSLETSTLDQLLRDSLRSSWR